MFAIVDKKTKYKKIAKIKGGDNHLKYLVVKPYKFSLKDLPKRFKNRFTEQQLDELEDALKTGFEPDDEFMKEVFYEALDEIQKIKRKGIRLNNGKFERQLDHDIQERIYVAGASGSGKTYYSTKLIKQYLSHHKKHKRENDFVLVSGVAPSDDLMEMLPYELDPQEIAMEGLDSSVITDSIILFDDVLSLPNQQVKKSLINCLNNLLETNRHTNTTVITINHLLTDAHNTRKILNECTSVVFFPNGSSKYSITKYLSTYENMDADLIRRIVNLPSRSVTLIKNHQPNIILHDKGAFFV